MHGSCTGGFRWTDPATIVQASPFAYGTVRGVGSCSRAGSSRRCTSDTLSQREKSQPFWRTKALEDLDPREWESLCDGCGRCCLLKLEDDETGQLHHTRLACRLLDIGSCRCRDYHNRHAKVSDCIRIDAAAVRSLGWLPPTCGYRLVAEGKDLLWWHPLMSGDPDTVHTAGISVRGLARSETGVRERDFERYIIAPDLVGRLPESRSPAISPAAKQSNPPRKAKTS